MNNTTPTQTQKVQKCNKMPENSKSSMHINQPELNCSPKALECMPVQSQQQSDELMEQLEKLFQCDPNDDDIYENTLCDPHDFAMNDGIPRNQQNENVDISLTLTATANQNSSLEHQSTETQSLDDRLESLLKFWSSLDVNKTVPQKDTKARMSKWLCEEYYLKSRYFDQLDLLSDTNRRKLVQVKKYSHLIQ